MSRSIPSLPRFSLWAALAVLVGSMVVESVLGAFFALPTFVFDSFGLISPEVHAYLEPSVQLLAKALACLGTVALVHFLSREPWKNLGLAGFKPALMPLAFLPIVAACTVFLSEVDNLLRFFFGEDGLGDFNYAHDLGWLATSSWIGVLLVVIVGPLVEEIVFRGLILRGLLGHTHRGLAIGASALLFAAAHLNPAQFPIAFVLGLVLGWVYHRTRSLGLCFLGHAINNAASYWGGWMPFEVANFNGLGEEGGFFHPWWFDGAALALFAMGVWLLHRWAPAPAPWERWQMPRRPEELVPPPLALPVPLTHALPPLINLPPVLGNPANPLGAEPPLRDVSRQMSAELAQLVTSLAQRARAASLVLATVPTAQKNAALEKLADLIDASHERLLAANLQDLSSPEGEALAPAARERLTLNLAKMQQLAQSVREVAALPDPVGEVLDERTRPNGIRIRKLRVPIGVIGIIYEARPNVTIDCAILCLKSGNASILRGGKECFHTNTALAALIQEALTASGLPADAVQLVPTTDRAALATLLKLDTLIHCVIPRGGEALIRYVAENSTIPVIKHYKGVCFVYADAAADLAMAEAITLNAKVSRPSVCNAAEQLLVHRSIAETFLPQVARALIAKNVQLRCDPESAAILDRAALAATPATTADYTTEFLDYIIAVRIVGSVDEAIAIINRDSSNHSDAIVTADEAAAKRFLAGVDSATVYWNASTRFTDGFEFGYGAEIGISTDRLHARGPMGLPELCSYKFVIEGNGQVRG